MKKVKSVNSTAFLNILSVCVLQGIAFLSTPIFSRMLGTEQYGQYAVINSWVSILTCFMGLGMGASLGTGVYHFKNKYDYFRNSILVFSTIICCLESVVVIIFGYIFRDFVKIEVSFLCIICGLSFSHYIVNFAQNAFIYEKKALENFILSCSTALLTTLLSIYLVWRLPNGNKYMGRVYGMLIPYVLISIHLLILLLFGHRISFEKQYLKFGFQVGFPIIFHSLSQTLLAQSDRVMMDRMGTSNSEIGIYSLFYTLSSVLTVLLNALNNSWCPFYYDNLSNNEQEVIKVKVKHYIELFTVLVFGFLMLSPEVSLIMADSSYSGGVKLLPILATAVYFTFMYQFPVNYEFYNKKTRIIASGTIGAAVLNVILNAVLIPHYGMYGAAIATCLSYMALFAVHFVIVFNLKGVSRYHTKIQTFVPGLLFVLVAVLIFYALIDFWYIRWAIGLCLGLYEVYQIIMRKSIF